jgi:Zn-dependent protease
MNLTSVMLVIPILMFSVILHEIAHGLAALWFGDDTAKREGRLDLNPLVHLDLFGSVLLPLVCYLAGAPMFGWAKPVPVNFYRLRPERLGTLCVTLAGIAVNFSLAIIAGLILRAVLKNSAGSVVVVQMLVLFTQINLMLAVFNLLPIPPLDGWRLWGVWIPDEIRMRIESNSMISIILLFLVIQFIPIGWAVRVLFGLIVGIR